MAEVTIPVDVVTFYGLVLPDVVTVADGDEPIILDNDGNVLIEVVNPTGSDLTIGATPQVSFVGLTTEPGTVTIAANSTQWLGPFPPAVFNRYDGGCEIVADSGLELHGLRL